MSARSGAEASSVWLRRTLWVLGLALAARLVSLWFNNTDLFFDEAQYWVWGKEPAFGYFSKPPVLGWTIGAFTAVCGDSTFCIRLPSPVFHTLTALIIFAATQRLFDARTAFWAALLYALLPAVSLSSTVISTDVPLLLFWALALYAFIRFEAEQSWRWAVVLGLAIGGGLMAKYAMFYFLLCAAIYALGSEKRPHILASAKFWVAVVIALASLLPNILWNQQNSFATVSHTGENIGWGGQFPNLGGLGEFFASQFGVMGPLMFIVYLAGLVRLPVEGMNQKQWLLIAFSAPVLLIICFQAVMAKAYANWAAAAYIAATIMVADFMVNYIPEWWRRVTVSLHLGVFAVLAIAVCFARPGQLPLPGDLNPFERMQGAEASAREAAKLIEPGDAVILTDNRRMSALMAYYLRDAGLPFAAWRVGEGVTDHFELTRAYQDDPRTPVFYMTRSSNPAGVIAQFDDAELLGTFKPKAGEIRQVWFYRLRDHTGAVQRQ